MAQGLFKRPGKSEEEGKLNYKTLFWALVVIVMIGLPAASFIELEDVYHVAATCVDSEVAIENTCKEEIRKLNWRIGILTDEAFRAQKLEGQVETLKDEVSKTRRAATKCPRGSHVRLFLFSDGTSAAACETGGANADYVVESVGKTDVGPTSSDDVSALPSKDPSGIVKETCEKQLYGKWFENKCYFIPVFPDQATVTIEKPR